MRGEQATFNLEIKKKSGLSINPDIHHSKVSSSGYLDTWRPEYLHTPGYLDTWIPEYLDT